MELQQPTSPEQISEEDNTGIHRSYLCIFCKRGFCTAQALGGHMNIHRKDRAKILRQTKSKEEYNWSSHSSSYKYNPYYSNLSQLSLQENHSLPAVCSGSYYLFSGGLTKNRRLLGGSKTAGKIIRDGKGGEEMRMKREEGEGRGLDLELRLGLLPSL